jgi:hypothetical protein
VPAIKVLLAAVLFLCQLRILIKAPVRGRRRAVTQAIASVACKQSYFSFCQSKHIISHAPFIMYTCFGRVRRPSSGTTYKINLCSVVDGARNQKHLQLRKQSVCCIDITTVGIIPTFNKNSFLVV